MRTAHQNFTNIYTFPTTAHYPVLYTQKSPGVYQCLPHNLDLTTFLSVASLYSKGACTCYRRSVRSKKEKALGPIHTMHHVSVLSPFHLCSIRTVCVHVHTVRRVQSLFITAHDRRPPIISIKYAAPSVF
jgi:hypothetical protein